MRDITSQVKVNGFLTDEILITRGVRQGDPLSALLYIIVAEVLGNLIRTNKDIKGITIKEIEQKILQYADDTQILVTNDESIAEVFRQLKEYELATGAKVNIRKTEGLFVGKWKNRHDKPFDCKWTNDKVFALGLWIGNKDTSEIIFTEQLAKIENKGAFWKPRKLSLIGRVHVVNIFILSRLWYRTEIFLIPIHILKELEKYIIDFVWAGKKHEVDKNILYANLEHGGLKLTNIPNKVSSQGIVWLSKLSTMEKNCFTRVLSEEQIGSFEGDYFGLDFLKTNSKCHMIKSKDSFYEEVIKAKQKFIMEFIPSKYNQLVEEHIFGNPRIVDSNGYPYKPMKDLIRLGIFRVRDLSFKSGTKKFNKKVFNAIREIRKHVPSQLNLPNTGSENPLKTQLGKKLIPFQNLNLKDIYSELQSQEKINEAYRAKWEQILNCTSLDWNKIWNNIHQSIVSADVKSIIYSQIHLGYFSEYRLVKNRSIQSATCKLCSEPLTELHHEIINCKVLLKVIDSFKTLISKLGRTETLSQQELAFGTLANSNKEQLRNFIVFIIRSIVHKSRGTVFRNQGQAIDKITNIAKQKMQKKYGINSIWLLKKTVSNNLLTSI